jgi:hypothetical protein
MALRTDEVRRMGKSTARSRTRRTTHAKKPTPTPPPPAADAFDKWTLEEAVLAVLDPEDRAELARLKAAGFDAPMDRVGQPKTESDHLRRRFKRFREKGQAELTRQLHSGDRVLTGRQPGNVERIAISADRWRHLEIDYVEGVVRGPGATTIVEIEISNAPYVVLFKEERLVTVGSVSLVLPDGLFKPLLTLAVAARRGEPLVENRKLAEQHFSQSTNQKVVAQAFGKVKAKMLAAGVPKGRVETLIQNVRGLGWQINLPPNLIRIEDWSSRG